MTATQDIVAKLWSLCHVLRDDGVTYSEYVTELTYLLFLKMMEETGEEKRIPEAYRWAPLARREGLDQLTHYRQTLTSTRRSEDRDRRHGAGHLHRRPDPAPQAREPQEPDHRHRRAGLVRRPRRGPRRSLRGPAAEERRGQEVRRRAVLHAAPADRLPGAPDAAEARARSSRTRPPAPAASSSRRTGASTTTTTSSSASPTASPRGKSANATSSPSWCPTPTGSA